MLSKIRLSVSGGQPSVSGVSRVRQSRGPRAHTTESSRTDRLPETAICPCTKITEKLLKQLTRIQRDLFCLRFAPSADYQWQREILPRDEGAWPHPGALIHELLAAQPGEVKIMSYHIHHWKRLNIFQLFRLLYISFIAWLPGNIV